MKVSMAARLLLIALSAFWTTAQAQFGRLELEPLPAHSCSAHIGGGVVFPAGKDGSNFERGWGVSGGGAFQVSPSQEPRSLHPVLFLGLEYLFARSGATPQAAMSTQASSSTQTVQGDFSVLSFEPEVRFYLSHRTMAYLSGGFGWLRRSVVIEGASNPTLLNPGGGASQTVVTNSGEADGGVGVQFGLRPHGGLSLYVEARAKKGHAINHNLILVPISAGVRW